MEHLDQFSPKLFQTPPFLKIMNGSALKQKFWKSFSDTTLPSDRTDITSCTRAEVICKVILCRSYYYMCIQG